MKKLCIAAILAAAMLLTACGEDAENISGSDISSTTAENSSSTTTSTSSAPESSTSDLTENISETDEEPEQEEIEKIQLTIEELNNIYITPMSINFFRTYKESGKSFDYTVSIDDVRMLDFALNSLVRIIEADEADDYEYIQDVWDEEYYYFKPETAEKLIQKHFLPSFSINSTEYTEAPYWNTEKGQFRVSGFDQYHGVIPKENYYFCESGYAVGEYCYVNVVPLADYPDIFLMENKNLGFIKMLDITSEYFDIPRVQLKLKKYPTENELYNIYVLVGFEPVDERPEWVKTAEQLFKDNDLENVEMIGLQASDKYGFNTPTSRTAGVISTPFGKRIYLYEKHYNEGMITFDYAHIITSFGIRGQNDMIKYSMSLNNRQGTGGSLNFFHNIDSSTFTCNDVLSGNTYVHVLEDGEIVYYEGAEVVDTKDVHEESWTLNQKDISEAEFNSAEVVSYFIDNFEGEGRYEPYKFDSLYTCEVTDCISLGEYFEMCRIIAE